MTRTGANALRLCRRGAPLPAPKKPLNLSNGSGFNNFILIFGRA